jgi:predicted ribosome quality control (RQC) complex YloA/Tae2 family protein
VRTNPAIVQQAALELEARLKGGKLQDAGRLPDGRVALALWSRGSAQLLCLDVFGSPPLVTLETGELPIVIEPGFVRALVTTLRGTTLLAVRPRENDRVLRLDFGTRSRFGVESQQSLIVELIPRFGNVVLVKDLDTFEGGTIVAALREFSLAENQTRAIEAGRPYEPPPLRPDTRAAEQNVEVAGSVLEMFTQSRIAAQEKQASTAGNHQRNTIVKTLRTAERRTNGELASIAEKRAKAATREDLRGEGEGIFATLHELDERSRAEAKERAVKLFTQYRKLTTSLPHLDERETKLRELHENITHLQWELERAEDADLPDIEEAISQTLRMSSRAATHAGNVRTNRQRKRKPLEFRTESGSRILVGRTPIENAELTFRVAQPDDVWFHVQGQPGAHVILHRDDRSEAPDKDIVIAAQLAAYHSKARNSTNVAVDYTQRKHVRKRPNAAPGLVFYTHPITKIVEPQSPAF